MKDKRPTPRSVNNIKPGSIDCRQPTTISGDSIYEVRKTILDLEHDVTMTVTDDCLKEMSPYYFLQQHHIEIENTLLSVIISRILSILQQLSIYAHFDAKQARFSAMTEDGIKFNINLFKSRRNKAVLLEVHKLSGNLSFKSIGEFILSAAKGIPTPPSTTALQRLSIGTLENVGIPSLSVEEQQQSIIVELKQCENMLNDSHVYSNLMGMKMLQNMTDYTSTYDAASLFAAKVVLGTQSNFHELTEKITSFLTNNGTGWEDDDQNFSVFEPESSFSLCYEALRVFSNALKTLEHAEEQQKVLDVRPFLHDELVIVLLSLLKEANAHPHCAYLSAKCMGVLVRNSNEAHIKAMDLDAGNTLMLTRQIGEKSHQLLANESSSVLLALS